MGKPSTYEEINEVLKFTPCGKKRIKHSGILDVDEIDNGLYLSSSALPQDLAQLRKLGITHILNAAEGVTFMHCNTGPQFYRGFKFTYKGLPADDSPHYDLSQHFDESVAFIDTAIKSGGRVLVHCLQGVSRSPTIIAAYFIKEKGMPAAEAMKSIHSKREITPNYGFIKQIAEYDKKCHEVP